MKAKFIYIIVALLAVVSCSKEDDIQTSQREIQVEVVDMQAQQTRAMLLNDSQEIIEKGEFALSAYLTDKKRPYFENECVFYFTPEGGGSPLWCFRDSKEQTNIVNFYWPADDNVNFVAYMPRNAASDDTANGASVVEDIKCNDEGNVTFSAKLPTTILDITAADREDENKKLEFVYAARKNQGKVGGDVKLRFVHPFAAVKFGLIQSHRDLTIHWIRFNNIVMSGDFSCGQDTYAPMDANPQNEGQSYLTHSNWTPNENQTKELKIKLEKNVPDDINYDQLIGGPYLVMPQSLDGVTMNVCFSWGDQYKETVSGDIQVNTDAITAWQPGKEYTYYLDLGDNKEEILFKVTVEPWTKGEDSGYENNYDVK